MTVIGSLTREEIADLEHVAASRTIGGKTFTKVAVLLPRDVVVDMEVLRDIYFQKFGTGAQVVVRIPTFKDRFIELPTRQAEVDKWQKPSI